jgi:hypothetical protein
MECRMNKVDLEQAEKFAKLIEDAGVEFTPENALKCIGFARDAMKAGECSVEAFYRAKQIILTQVEVTDKWVN